MKRLVLSFLFLLGASMLSAATIYDFTPNAINGQPQPLSAYKGKVVLLVNVASRCGYTPQYTGLEALYEKYRDHGLVVLGFPANNFGGQEPGSNEEIKTFCSSKYNVQFPMFAKMSVKGADQSPLYAYLTDKSKNAATGGDIKWNFTKFLIGRDGKILGRFESNVEPDSPEIRAAIEQALR